MAHTQKYIETYSYDNPHYNYERLVHTLVKLQTLNISNQRFFYKKHMYHVYTYKTSFNSFYIDPDSPSTFLSGIKTIKQLLTKIIDDYEQKGTFDIIDYYNLNKYIIDIVDYNENMYDFTNLFTTLKV
jgi:hypothetical protein